MRFRLHGSHHGGIAPQGQVRAVGVGALLKTLVIKTPVINIPGCTCHPEWFIGTVARVLLFGLPKPSKVDEHGRLKIYYGKTIHSRCINRDALDEGAFSSNFGEPGCLLEIGCKDPFAFGDCTVRQWNSGVNWCIAANAPCMGCTEPGFPDAHPPLYQRT